MVKTYIIHVSDDLIRERHIMAQLAGKGLAATFINKGDKKDLTEQVLDTYFTGNRKNVSNSTSCVYKHILAYENIVANKDTLALVLEDDIVFYKNFKKYLPKIIAEIAKEELAGFIVSLEDSLLRYIPRSERVRGKYLYPRSATRYAGAYLIDYQAARRILQRIAKEKCPVPMDWYHDDCAKKGILQIFWSQPTLAIQYSHTGRMATLLDDKGSGLLRVISFYLQWGYKRLYYFFR